MWWRVAILAGLLMLLAPFPGDAGQQAGAPVFTGVTQVIDGDTLDIGDTRVRLGGIDAPERSERCALPSGADWACGRWAWHETERLLQGRMLACTDLGTRSHDRVVARCTLDGRDVADLLIRHGVARICERFAAEQGVLETYQRAEVAAAAQQAGIFGGPLNPPAGFCRRAAPATVQAPGSDCAIKGNVSANGRIYHLPGQAHYDRVTMAHPDTRWFCSEAEARAAGWRPALR